MTTTDEARPEHGPGTEGLLAAVLRAAPVALLLLDLDGVVTMAAGSALRVDPDLLVGRRVLDLVDEPEQAVPLQRALAGEELTSTVPWAGRWWQTSYRPVVEHDRRTGTVGVYTDVTERVQAEQARAAGEADLRAVLEAAREAILVVDPEGRVAMANRRCAQLLGGREIVGQVLRELVDEGTAAALEGRLARRAAGLEDRYELKVTDPQGRPIWLLVSASPLPDADGGFRGSVAVLTDITAAKEEQHRLSAAALTDPLTGVGNRAALTGVLLHALARRDAHPLAVLFCDVDALKDVNDRHGHAGGDALLRHVASAISGVLRPEDVLARYAGDEFVVVCEGVSTPEEALALGERVRTAVHRPAGEGPRVTVSVGVALGVPPTTAEALLQAADAAAYEAKRAGRDRVALAG